MEAGPAPALGVRSENAWARQPATGRAARTARRLLVNIDSIQHYLFN